MVLLRDSHAAFPTWIHQKLSFLAVKATEIYFAKLYVDIN
jgi:hypothetical protein